MVKFFDSKKRNQKDPLQNRTAALYELTGDLADDAEFNMNCLLKEEGNLTHGLNELLEGTEYTLNEIYEVESSLSVWMTALI